MLAGLDIRPELPRTMLLLHGGGVGPWQWKKQIEEFSDFRVLAPELPGHGDSAGILPCTIRNCVDQVRLFLDAKVGDGPVILIGHSLGAQVALQLLAEMPQRFERAAILSALAIPTPYLYRYLIAPFIGLTAWLLKFDWIVRYSARQFRFPDASFVPAFKRSIQSIPREVLDDIYLENQLFCAPAGLARVQSPLLVVAAKREIGAMKRSVPLIMAACGGRAEGAILAGANHTFPWSASERTNAGLRAWIEGRALPEGWNYVGDHSGAPSCICHEQCSSSRSALRASLRETPCHSHSPRPRSRIRGAFPLSTHVKEMIRLPRSPGPAFPPGRRASR
jgi:pimeloyl-ACP methyl ester carboxylesterase